MTPSTAAVGAPAKPGGHIPILDSLRGLAALVVVISHSANEGFLPRFLGVGFGQLGVTMFFALSGFLMAHIYFERGFDADEVRAYAVSRCGRVLPLYLLVVAGCSFLLFTIGTSLYGIMDWRGVVANLALIRGDGVFWSIPVEIHFYVVFVALWWGHASGRLALVAASLLALEVALQILLRDADISSRWLIYWLHIFLAGVGIAVLRRWLEVRGKAPLSGRWHVLGWVAVGIIPLLPPVIRATLGIPTLPYNLDPFGFGGPLLLLFCAVFALGPIQVLDTRWARWLGRVSFGIYLLHIPVLIVARELGPWIGDIPGSQFAVTLIGTLIGARISFQLIEAPAASLARRRLLPKADRPAAVSAGGIEGTSRPAP